MARIVSIHSFRGGTGKSNLTANLAVTVARTGKRVGIIDTDIQSPGIHVLFGLKPNHITHALNDYLWGRCEIKECACDVTSVISDGAAPGTTLYLIPSSIKVGEIARILREGFNVSLLHDGFRGLIEELKLDYLFIDTHPGVNEETLLSIALSSVLLVVLRPDNQDFQGTAVTVDLARKLDVQELQILVNKIPETMDLEALREKVETAYGAPVAGMFPLNLLMVQLASGGIFSLEYPQHPFALEVKQVAAGLSGKG